MYQFPLPADDQPNLPSAPPVFPSAPPHEYATRAARSAPTIPTVLGVALLSAVLGSGLTLGVATAFGGALQLAGVPTLAPSAAQPASTADGPSDLTGVVASARESVVTITARGAATAVGSGFVVSSNGLILTNYHVVEGAQRLSVATSDGQTLDARIISTDEAHDLAVIRASGGALKAARLGDSDQLLVGQTVLAIGSPLGEFTETVTRGIVSALDRDITVGDQATGASMILSGLIQTDAAINPGNSGGPLINERGEVIGINSAASRQAEGIGFAIPINAAKALVDRAAASAA
jgi:serine protease Do